jgi:hypothetical protein
MLQTKCSFSLDHYFDVIETARNAGYAIGPLCDFHHMKDNSKKFIILRHDVDLSLNYALKLAKLEADRGLRAIYYVLLHTDLYNAISEAGSRALRHMSDMGHEIGLHIDTRFFRSGKPILSQIEDECKMLENITGKEVLSISQHTPIITPDLSVELASRYIEARDPRILEHLKYISDSGRNWRQGCMCNHIGKADRFQILTHPIWWVTGEQSRDLVFDRLKVDAINEMTTYVENFRLVVYVYVTDQLHQNQ